MTASIARGSIARLSGESGILPEQQNNPIQLSSARACFRLTGPVLPKDPSSSCSPRETTDGNAETTLAGPRGARVDHRAGGVRAKPDRGAGARGHRALVQPVQRSD